MLNNIILRLKPLFFLLGALSFIFCDISKSTFLFCLNSDVSPLSIKTTEGRIETDISELNYFFDNNGINKIEKWIPQATEQDFDGDIYLNRIYRVYINDDKQGEINLIINNLDKMNFVNYAENEFVRKPKYYPNDAMANIQCSLNSVKAPSAWDFGIYRTVLFQMVQRF